MRTRCRSAASISATGVDMPLHRGPEALTPFSIAVELWRRSRSAELPKTQSVAGGDGKEIGKDLPVRSPLRRDAFFSRRRRTSILRIPAGD
jgi:hypothetical protein